MKADIRRGLALIVLLSMAGCAIAPEPVATAPPPPVEPAPPPAKSAPPAKMSPRPPADATSPSSGTQEPYVKVEVLYGTDRQRTGESSPARKYGGRRGQLEYGVAQVSIPSSHRRGELEEPVWWLGEFREDPARHVVLLSADTLSAGEFALRIRERTTPEGKRDVLVFIHGFNVSFEEAVRRTAQIAHDIPFPGTPVSYSWPSTASIGPVGYRTDEGNVKWTEPNLRAFLTRIKASVADDVRVHLLAHSMGNRALSEVLRSMSGDADAAPFSQVILAAPDIDRQTFEEQIAPAVVRMASRTTLYASSTDRALKLSAEISSYPRAGQSDPPLVFVHGLDTIDATGIDTGLLGHSYIGSKPIVLTDLFNLLRFGMTPADRKLRPVAPPDVRYWQFAP